MRHFPTLAALILVLALGTLSARAHEGHDHDKPPPLALPVAPRVVSVTPDFELVGVLSGKDRLTIFLHAFATNEPIKGAHITVAAGDQSVDAEARGEGVFNASAPWLSSADGVDLVFTLQLADGNQDLMAGRLEAGTSAAASTAKSGTAGSTDRILAYMKGQLGVAAIGGLIGGVLLTLFAVGYPGRRGAAAAAAAVASEVATESKQVAATTSKPIKILRRTAGALATTCLIDGLLLAQPGVVPAALAAELPSVPSTMVTDLAQRTPDGTLFVPKATQHLLSVRTILTAPGSAARSVELHGTIIAGPQHFGRVQPGRPGRIEAPPAGLAHVGLRVEKGQVLGYVKSYIEAADRANIDSQIAETEARIAKNRTILSRYEGRPGAVPQVKVDEVRGELDALTRKRAELVPSTASREPILAPISGVVSLAATTIGQIVDARDILFEIVDPSEFWVEAHSHNIDAVKDLDTAYAVFDHAAHVAQMPLQFAGRGLALHQQSAKLSFKILRGHEGLAIGMPVKVILQSKVKIDGFVVPASAIVRGQTGLPIVWIKTEPERFEPQTVKVEPLDGTNVVVAAGLKADQRIVTEGATLLNQVR